ncbi:HAD family phosphatase [Segetibacter sp.]|jgi:beta-phosphoglucomutase|uniref:HAD family hydrolase n=1 Tax=Segetibacter sp. TaxID=2231182 RepID=UPI00262F4252|nr:HAD family phosphatase [Segetibacter sp.]MCW3078790.1 haloacid dehalogenase superfamily protein [Segetibacter sp.]
MNLAVLFDMDGVIVDSNPYHKLAFEAFLKRHDVFLTDDELKRHVYGRTNQEIMRFIFKDNFSEARSEIWADEKEALFRELYKEVSPVKGLVSFLQTLKAKDVKTAVGTSAPKINLYFILEKIHLIHYFDTLLHSADVLFGKPNPEIYLKAAARLQIEPKNCIVIEDSLPGIKAGLDAGMKVIGITTTHTAEELANAHLVIEDFEGLSVHAMLDLL